MSAGMKVLEPAKIKKIFYMGRKKDWTKYDAWVWQYMDWTSKCIASSKLQM